MSPRLDLDQLPPVEHALVSIRAGYKIVQLEPRGKKPIMPHGVKDATNDEATIRALWRTNPASNFGIATGELLVIDADTKGEFERLCKSLGHPVPETLVVNTANGDHWYFKQPGQIGNSGALRKLGFNIDTRGRNGYVVGAGSVHESGVRYKARNPGTPIAELPEWLAEIFENKETKQGAAAPRSTWDGTIRWEGGVSYETNGVSEELGKLDDLAKLGWDGPGWDNTVHAVACNLLEFANADWTKLTVADTEALIHQHAPTDADFGPEQIDTKIRSAKSITAGKTRPRPRILTPPAPSEVQLADSPLAEWVAERVHDTHCWAAGRGWMEFDGKVWREVTDATMVEVVRQQLIDLWKSEAENGADVNRLKQIPSLLTAGKIRAVVGLVKGIIEVDAADFDRHPHLLNCQNGVVDLHTSSLLPHDPELRLTKISKVAFCVDAHSEDWDRALDALPPEVIDWMQVRFGQAATGYMVPDDVLPVLQGNGSNGKSTVVAAVMAALGDHAIVVPERVLLSNPSDHPTELTTLQGARLALIEETPEARHLSVKRLKDVLGTPTMTARRIRENNVTWEATHSLMLTSNYRPMVAETDHGTWRRLALVRFPFTFRPQGEKLLTSNDRHGDLGLRERLRAGLQGQREAVLAWVVEGARRWFEAGRVMPTTPAAVSEDTNAWRAESDLVFAYALDRLDFDPQSAVLSTDLFGDFSEWLIARGHKPWGDQTFASRFGGHDELSRRGVTKERTTSFAGLSRPHGESARGVSGKQRVWRGVLFQGQAKRGPASTATTLGEVF